MPKIILILALLFGAWYWWSYLRKLPKDKSRPFLWKTGFWLVLGIATYLVLTGKMHWLGAGIAALVPLIRSVILWGFRAAPLMRLLGRFKTTPSQFRTQSLVVTINFASGQITGEAADISDLKTVKNNVPNLPVLANTGVKHETVEEIFKIADGCIVGSALKYSGDTWQSVDPDRAQDFMNRVKKIRSQL